MSFLTSQNNNNIGPLKYMWFGAHETYAFLLFKTVYAELCNDAEFDHIHALLGWSAG